MKGKICLNMIVKNESKTLPRLFASVQNVVDFYVISDTGSSDNTLEVIKELGEKYAIPGIVTQDNWVSFSHNRNIALQNAYKFHNEGVIPSCWLLIIDADEELNIKPEFDFNNIKKECSYNIFRNDRGMMFTSISLISFHEKDWYWEGEIHNYLMNKSKSGKKDLLTSLEIIYNNFEGAKSHAFKSLKDKFLKDKELLEIELNHVDITKTNSHRFFQLATACEGAELYDESVQYFKITSQIEDSQYHYNSLCKIGCILFERFNHSEEAIQYLQTAISRYPKRKDAYFYLAKIHQQNQEFHKAYDLLILGLKKDYNEIGVMFDSHIYSWKILFQLITVCIALKDYKQSREFIHELIGNQQIPLKEKLFIEQLQKIVENKLSRMN